MKLVCVHCETELKVMRVGAPVVEMFGDPPRPYKIWASDVLSCPSCHCEIAAMTGTGPIAEHHEKDFQYVLGQVKRKRVVYDYERRERHNDSGVTSAV